MKELPHKFENKHPGIVFEWKDAETKAKGRVMTSPLRSGTHMHNGLNSHRAAALAKTETAHMSVNIAFARLF